MKIKKTTKTEADLVNLRSSNLSTIGSPKYAKTPQNAKAAQNCKNGRKLAKTERLKKLKLICGHPL